MKAVQPELPEVLRALGLLAEPGQVTELRLLDVRGQAQRFPATMSGYFNDFSLRADNAIRGSFIKNGRTSIPKWCFAPPKRLEAVFELLVHSDCCFRLKGNYADKFTNVVRMDGRTGRACGEEKARTITLALAEALGPDPRTRLGGNSRANGMARELAG